MVCRAAFVKDYKTVMYGTKSAFAGFGSNLMFFRNILRPKTSRYVSSHKLARSANCSPACGGEGMKWKGSNNPLRQMEYSHRHSMAFSLLFATSRGGDNTNFSNTNRTALMSTLGVGVAGAITLAEAVSDEENTSFCAGVEPDTAPVESEDLSGRTNDISSGDTPTPMVFPDGALKFDTYNGVTIHLSKLSPNLLLPSNRDYFATTLKNSLQIWKDRGHRGIWIHIPTEYSHIIESCTKIGFDFQYANSGLLVMTKVR